MIITAIGRAVPTSKSWDGKAEKDYGDYLRSFFSFKVKEAGPGG